MSRYKFSSLHLLMDTAEGSDLLLDYYAAFTRRIFAVKDFKNILTVFFEELRKIYSQQEIEIILSHDKQVPTKFTYDAASRQAVPVKEFNDRQTLYTYVLSKRQAVLTNNYEQFCDNLSLEKGALPANAWLGIPMNVGSKVLGAVVVWNKDDNYFLRFQDKQFLTTVTNVVSQAIENVYLYDYVKESNGGLRVFDTALPRGKTRNSIKSVLNQLLFSVLAHPTTEYTGLFLGTPQNQRWALLNEAYGKAEYADISLRLKPGFPAIPLNLFDSPETVFWQQSNQHHFLNDVFRAPLKDVPADAALVFPFVVNNRYLGAWVILFNGEKERPAPDEILRYEFIHYLITQLIEKKALLEQANKYDNYLKHLERMKTMGELASSTAHHMNNILSVIIGKGQLLQKHLGESEHYRDLELILKAASDGAANIQRLQNYATRKESPKGDAAININGLVQEVVDIARPRFEGEAQSRGIHYELDLNLGTVKPVHGNAEALREVALNLINNALDAMPRGGKLSIQTTLKENNVLIFVSDTGIGIPPEIRHKIFDKFYTTKGNQGNGLGLNIALEIVQRHKGTIYVDSIVNKGSIFMIELPASGEPAITTDGNRPKFYQPLNYRVLLVEDEGFVRETLAEMLEEEGCYVKTASNAREALLQFQKYECDVVFADLSMPKVNGVELARDLREINPSIPIFIVTGWNQTDNSLKDAGAVIDGVIKKPFNMELIRQEMLRVIGSSTHYHKNGYSV